MQKLTGHLKQRRELFQLIKEARLPSALIFSGLSGIGKALIANEIARALLCQQQPVPALGGCGACNSCALFDLGNHPDIHRLDFSTEKGVSVDDVRALLERIALKPFMGGSRIAILNDADQISTIGANILLKTLEEPRPNTFFILVASNPSRLPSTILSRCQKLFFDRLGADEIREIMSDRNLEKVSDHLIALADGSAANLDSLQSQADMWDEVKGALDHAWNGDHACNGRAAQDWGADKGRIEQRLALIRATIRQKMLNSNGDSNAASVWGVALQNALDAEYLIMDRHVNPTLVILKILNSCNQNLAPKYQHLPHTVTALGDMIY